MKTKTNQKKLFFSLLLSFICILFFSLYYISQIKLTAVNQKGRNNILKDPTQIVLSVGKDETQLNFAWYSKENEPIPKIKIGTDKDLKDSTLLKVFRTKATPGFYSNKAYAKNLKENTFYYYSYTINEKWQPVLSFYKKPTNRYSFLAVGDPQIGASYQNVSSQETAVQKDSFYWNKTLCTALKTNPDCHFLISMGDQIQSREKENPSKDYNQNEIEYSGFFTPAVLRTLPIACCIGNHDSPSKNYSYHFYNPNSSNLGATMAGGDYYFTYGNTLFLILNSNSLKIEEHKQFIQKAIQDNPDITWKITAMHHDIYGSGQHITESDTTFLREELTPILEKYNMDLVLTGHDHSYSRSFLLKQGKKSKYGILYLTLNSSSGSKYYNLLEKIPSYIAYSWQESVPTYCIITVTDTTIVIQTYRTDNEKLIDTFTLQKTF